VPRSASVTVAGLTVTVTKAGAVPTITLAPNPLEAAAHGGSYPVTVTTPDGSLTWHATSHASWLIIEPSLATGSSATTMMTAGNGTAGLADGTGTEARFNIPSGVLVGSDGFAYVLDSYNYRVRRMDLDTGMVTTIGGGGTSIEGPLDSVSFTYPWAIVADIDGSALVGDQSLLRRISPDWTSITTVAGAAGASGYVDGPIVGARFNGIHGVTVGRSGAIFIGDTYNHVVRMISADRSTVSTLATGFNYPRGVVELADGSVLVADNRNCQLRRVLLDGTVSTVTGGVCTVVDGPAASARFTSPSALLRLGDGRVLVGDGPRIRVLSADLGTVSTLIDLTGQASEFRGLSVAANGDLVAVEYGHRVWVFRPAGARALWVQVPANVSVQSRAATITVQQGASSGELDVTQVGMAPTYAVSPSAWTAQAEGGSRAFALEASPADAPWTATTASGWLTVSPSSGVGSGTITLTAAPQDASVRPRVRTVAIAGVAVTVTQQGLTPRLSFSPNPLEIGASAGVYGVALDVSPVEAGTSWVASSDAAWLFVEPSIALGETPQVVLVAGDGTADLVDGAGEDARFNIPSGVIAGANGIAYIADSNNRRLRKLDLTTGAVETIGGGDSTTDGSLDGATFGYPWVFTEDLDGSVLVGDVGALRRVSPDWTTVETAAGELWAFGSVDGPLQTARFGDIRGIALAPDGRIFLSDNANNAVRVVSADRTTVSTLVTGLSSPRGLVWLSDDSLLVADTWAHQVRRFRADGTLLAVLGSGVPGSVDGPSALAGFSVPSAMVSLGDGRILVGDGQRIRIISADLASVTTLLDLSGLASDLRGLSITRDGDLLASDYGHRVFVLRPVGTRDLMVRVAANRSAQPRSASVLARYGDAAATLMVHQAGSSASFALSDTIWSAPTDGGTHQVTLTAAPADAPWTATSNAPWLTVTPSSGVGSASLTLTALPHTTSVAPRSASVTVAGVTITVTQTGASPTFSLGPATWTAAADGGTHHATLTAAPDDASWNATSSAPWLTVTPSSGVGSATLTLTAVPHASSTARSASVAVGSAAMTITQDGVSATFAAAPATWAAASPGGTQLVSLTATPVDAPWTATSDAAWLTVTPASGVGSATLTLTAAPHIGARDARTASVTIGAATVTVTQAGASLASLRWKTDFPGSGHAAFVVWEPSTGLWSVSSRSPNTGVTTTLSQRWGAGSLGDVPVPGDYDGDGRADIAVWRPHDGRWYILHSSTEYGAGTTVQWGSGAHQDVPVPGDYDGDGRTDLAVWRPATGIWYVRYSSTGYTSGGAWSWGAGSLADIPVPGDYDGDGRTDLAVWRPSSGTWFVRTSSTLYAESLVLNWGSGALNDVPVPGDFDGDGRTDVAVWRPGSGVWFIRTSTSAFAQYFSFHWGSGQLGDVPLAHDYDGDGRAEITIWRPGARTFYVRTSSSSFADWFALAWGTATAVPVR
jgi:hypothetical protein